MSKLHRREELLFERLRLDDRAGPARRISKDQAADFLDQALSTWEREQDAPKRSRGALWPSLAVAAGLLLAVVGGASAAHWYYGRTPQAAPERVVQHASPRSVVVEQELAPRAEIGSSGRRVARMIKPAERPEPDDLLQKANRLRAEGRFQSAAETYTQVYERYPRSLSAYAAQVAAASIELEHLGKPLRAQRLFESALHAHPSGALDLEARQGLALSLRDLGKPKAEALALRALVAAHAQSPAARRAEARLKELSDLGSRARGRASTSEP